MNIRKLSYTALFICLGLIIPFVFHAVGLGSAFTPMHLPILLCGLCCGPVSGLICGIICPYLSSFLTGMPPLFPTAFTMTFECAIYGLIGGLLYRKLKLNLYISLILAILAGKVAGGLVMLLILGISNYSFDIFFTSYIVSCLPGIIMNIIVVPILVIALEKTNLIPTNDLT